MKIYVVEKSGYVGYTLLNDKDQIYTMNAFKAENSRNPYIQGIEKALFYVLGVKPLYANETPFIYIQKSTNSKYDDTSEQLRKEVRAEVRESFLVKKFAREKDVSFILPVLNEYTEQDRYFLMIASNQIKFKMPQNVITKNRGR